MQDVLRSALDPGSGLAAPNGLAESGVFRAGSVRIRTAPMLRIQGYSDPERAPGAIRDIALAIAERAAPLFDPATWYREFAIGGYDGAVLRLENGVALHCGGLPGLAGCRSIVAFVLTVGGAVDAELRQLEQAGDLAGALFLETAAWLGVEAATKAFVACLRAGAAARGLALTRRFAPGYDDWPLAGQDRFFSLFEAGAVAVRVLESGLMVPRMSRSGLYGLRSR